MYNGVLTSQSPAPLTTDRALVPLQLPAMMGGGIVQPLAAAKNSSVMARTRRIVNCYIIVILKEKNPVIQAQFRLLN